MCKRVVLEQTNTHYRGIRMNLSESRICTAFECFARINEKITSKSKRHNVRDRELDDEGRRTKVTTPSASNRCYMQHTPTLTSYRAADGELPKYL